MRWRNGRNQPQKNAENAKRRTVILPPHEPLGTSNTQPPINGIGNHWLFDVGCWVLDVSFGSANFSGKSLPCRRWHKSIRAKSLLKLQLPRIALQAGRHRERRVELG